MWPVMVQRGHFITVHTLTFLPVLQDTSSQRPRQACRGSHRVGLVLTKEAEISMRPWLPS